MKNRIVVFINCLLLYIYLISSFSCSSKKISEQEARRSENWIKNSIIYEVDLNAFSKEGTFKALTTRLSELRSFGVSIISIMPIHPIGELNKKGKLGNPYSVKDLYSVNSEFGTLEDFKVLVDSAHNLGLKIIIEFIANQAAWDSQLLMEHPEWFVQNEEGAIVSPNAEWYDVAKLDLNQHEPRKYMISAMKYWINSTSIDGFKCFSADSVPISFWEIARSELEKIKPIVMIAESRTPEHHLNAFDLTYSWDISNTIDMIIAGRNEVSIINDSMEIESGEFPRGSLHLRSINKSFCNIDSSFNGTYFQLKTKINAVLQFTLPGIPIIYNGEEVGFASIRDYSNKNKIDWSRNLDTYNLYVELIRLRNSSPVLVKGNYSVIKNSDLDKLFSFIRTSETDTLLIALNISNEQLQTQIYLSSRSANIWLDYFSKDEYKLKDSILTIQFKPYNYAVLIPLKGK